MIDRTKAPQVRPFGNICLPPEQISVLSNGLTFHCFNGCDQDVARLTISVEGGTLDVDNPCIASFAGELLREGNPSANAEKIADIIDFNGAWLNSLSNSHFTNIQLTSLSPKLDSLADIAVDCFCDPSVPQNSLDVIRQKAIARQQLNLSRVSFLASADIKKQICGPKHRESQIVASREIESLTRRQILDFHLNRLDAGLTHAYLCGKLTPALIDSIARKLEKIPTAAKKSPIEIVPYDIQPPTVSFVEKSDSIQSAVCLALPAVSRNHPDYDALRMTITALGGYFGSRLMMNIREDKGYTYGISAALLGTHEGSYTLISAQCDNNYTDSLIHEVRNELIKMATEPLSDDEMKRLTFNVYSDLASTLDSPFNIMDYYELQRVVGTPKDYFARRLQTIKTLTPQRICQLSEQYLRPEQLHISIAGKQ